MERKRRRGEEATKVVDHEAADAAREAGLRYVTDARPGITRRRAGPRFRYLHPDGGAVREDEQLRRIRSLAVPPAWERVWICPHPLGHIQATGRDAKGRKQYRYHPRWREVRDESKYGRLLAFGAALPLIRERTTEDLALPGLPRRKVLATVVELLEKTLIRVGNEEYARKNASYGLTTLRDRHVEVHGRHLVFHFRGKSGKEHVIDVSDPRLAGIVKRCQDLPGQELFHFRDEAGILHPIESNDVNAYLHEATGESFTAKDFRTWHGTALATVALAELAAAGPPTKKQVVVAIQKVAARLGNTPTVCRKSYIHPAVVTRYLRGELAVKLDARAEQAAREAALLAILKDEAAREGEELASTLERSVHAARSRKKPSKRHAA